MKTKKGVPKKQMDLLNIAICFWCILFWMPKATYSQANNWLPCSCVDNQLSCVLGPTILHQNRTCSQASLVNVRDNALISFPGDLNTYGSSRVLSECNDNTNCVNRIRSEVLSVLDISDNYITKLPYLPNVCSLVVINVANNDLRTIKERLNRCDSLEALNLAGNQFENLPIRALSGLKKLRVLELSYNPLHYLPPRAFKDSPELEVLRASEVRLRFLPKTVFANLTKLWFLDLSNNHLTYLGRDVFIGLRSLQYLKLQSNYLRHAPNGVFREQGSLVELDLSYNNFSHLCNRDFVGLLSLNTLRVQNNFLTVLPLLADVCPQLQDAHFENNIISALSQIHVRKMVCGALSSTLFLAGNPIRPSTLCWATRPKSGVEIHSTNDSTGCYTMHVYDCGNSTVKFCDGGYDAFERSFSEIFASSTPADLYVSEELEKPTWCSRTFLRDMSLVLMILLVIGLYAFVLSRKQRRPKATDFAQA